MKYLYSKQFDSWIEEERTVKYTTGHDGLIIEAGSLLGSGFTPDYMTGSTLPEEINGIPVTELRGTFHQNEVGYIEATKLKRINIEVIVDKNFHGDRRCHFPCLCGGVQNTIQSIRIVFLADKANINPVGDAAVRSALTYVGFGGKVIDDADWDYGSFQSGLFAGCTKLEVIRGSFEGYSLTDSTFEGCTSLVSLPDIKVKQMGDREFFNCTALPKIYLHDGLTQIGSYCFKNCKSLTDIFIPDTVTYIGIGAFDGCVRLETIHFSKAITELPKRLFANCEKLQKVFLSDGTKMIDDEAFIGCASLKKPWLPEGLTHIGEKAFYGCVSMKSIFIPETVTSISPDAFSNCGDLVIQGKAGTVAEQYAKNNNLEFVVD